MDHICIDGTLIHGTKAKCKLCISQYVLELISFMDGQGLVVTDYELIGDSIKELGNFSVLRSMFSGELKESEYPTVNGWYWFYGDPFAKGNGHKTETRIYSVKVIHVDGVPKYIADGDFFMNHKPGLWAEALVPEKQAISKLE